MRAGCYNKNSPSELMIKKILYIVYPFFIACFPILALRNHNIVYVDLASIVRTLLIVILLTAVIWVVFFLIFRNWAKAGIASGLAMLMILSYGQLHIQSAELLGNPIRHTYLLILLGFLYLVFLWLALRNPASLEASRNFLAVTALALVLMNLGQSLYYDYGTYQAKKVLLSQSQQPERQTGSANLPDVYLIILDGHGRQDVLKNNFGFDNSSFIQELQKLGFYVAGCSQSNYASTNLSLSSVFSMNYIPAGLGDTAKLPPFKETTLRNTLYSLGYTIITFENRSSGHFDLQEDIRLSQNQLLLGEFNLTGGINEFEEEMLQTTILKLFWDTHLIPGFNEEELVRLENYEHYKQTKFILSKLKDVPKLKSPKFVFVHILAPHDPYVFTADGKFKSVEDKSKNGYRDNAEFIDQNILPALQSIINESERPPLIVLMGDHGPPSGKYATREDRMENLNAYFVNPSTMADLYPSITPVNSFRVIFNHYFGGSYPLLEDVSHYAYKLKQLSNAPIVQNTCTSQK
jgi:hypothetical protein